MSIEELKLLQSSIIRKNKTCNIIGLIVIGIVMSISTFGILSSSSELHFSIILLFIELIFSIIILSMIKSIVNGKNIKKFNKEFKNAFVLKSLHHFFDDINYKPEKGFNKGYIQNLGMLNTGDKFNSNDYISGTYKNIKFEQSDIHIEKKEEDEDENGDKEVAWETIFKGRLMIFEFNKKFKTDVQVLSNHFGANALIWNKKLSNVKMEDIDFNKHFTVYAESEHDAFYILTPHFMEKLKDITKKLNCGVMFGFADSRLHIAIYNSEDSFEYNVFKPINEQEIEESIVKDIKLITNFVDELNLDNNLFRREV